MGILGSTLLRTVMAGGFLTAGNIAGDLGDNGETNWGQRTYDSALENEYLGPILRWLDGTTIGNFLRNNWTETAGLFAATASAPNAFFKVTVFIAGLVSMYNNGLFSRLTSPFQSAASPASSPRLTPEQIAAIRNGQREAGPVDEASARAAEAVIETAQTEATRVDEASARAMQDLIARAREAAERMPENPDVVIQIDGQNIGTGPQGLYLVERDEDPTGPTPELDEVT